MLLIATTLLLFVLQVLDTYTTTTIDDLDGIKNNDEQMPVTKWLFDHFGRNATLNVKTVAVTAAGYWLGSNRWLFGDVIVEGLWIELVLVMWYIVVVFGYNWRSMPK